MFHVSSFKFQDMSPIANMLVQLKNAQAIGMAEVSIPFSKMKFEIVKILESKGFIGSVEKKQKKLKKTEVAFLDVKLKYDDANQGAIGGIKLISKPSRRWYASKQDLRPVRSGFGVAVVSTSKGLMTGEEAKRAGLGGEVLFEIW